MKRLFLFVFFLSFISTYAQQNMLDCRFVLNERGQVDFYVTNITDSTIYFNFEIYNHLTKVSSHNFFPARLEAGKSVAVGATGFFKWNWVKGFRITLNIYPDVNDVYECPYYDKVYEKSIRIRDLDRVRVYERFSGRPIDAYYNPYTNRVIVDMVYYEITISDMVEYKYNLKGSNYYLKHL